MSTAQARLAAEGNRELENMLNNLDIPSITTMKRDVLTPRNGMQIYNVTLGIMQRYENGTWTNQISGSPLLTATHKHIFYYPWYGTPAIDGEWRHWNNNGYSPGDGDIDADYMPSLGPYSSNDPDVLATHMQQIKEMGIDVIVVSWWGQGSFEDLAVPAILDAAQVEGIKVAWHIEPYVGRTAASSALDVAYIYTHYGSHPAFYRVSKPNKWGVSTAARGVFYVFDSLSIADATWVTAITSLRGTSHDPILLAQTTDASKVDLGHWDGLYVYDTYSQDGSNYFTIGTALKANNSLWAPTVGPGFYDERDGEHLQKDRNNGATYDTSWVYTLGSLPTFITINSFNEWHEGGQIEPATAYGSPYHDFNGAYGLTGVAAETAYLQRTKFWTQAPQLVQNVPLVKTFARGQYATAIPSANNITLPITANVFHISGTTTINVLDALHNQGGDPLTLIFEGVVTVKHNQAAVGTYKPLILQGAADFVTAGNNVLQLVWDNIGNAWMEVSRKT